MLRSTTDPEFVRDTEAYVVGFHEGHAAAIETEERPSTPAGGGGRRSVWAALIVAVGLVVGGWLARSPAPHTTTQTVDQVVDMGEYGEDPAKGGQRSPPGATAEGDQPVDAPVQDDPAPSTPQPDAAAEPVAVQPEAPPTSEPAPAPDPQPDPTTPPPAPEPPEEPEPPQDEPAEDDGLLTPVVDLVDGVLEIVGLGGGEP